jgi:iron complex outermembrane receptor protein
VTQDHEYFYLAGRGFSAPGEYAGRIIVMIDGYRADDSFFGQAYMGEEGILDVATIERVEYIPGGNSAGYSNGALLGAINIITKKGADVEGVQFALGYGSHSSQSRRVTYGDSFENGADILLSASDYKTAGRDYTFMVNGVALTQSGQSAQNSKHLLLKASYENISLEGGYSERRKDELSYPYSSLFLEPNPSIGDVNGFARLKYDGDIVPDLKLSSSLWYGAYQYKLNEPDVYAVYDLGYVGALQARWYGGDMKLIATWFENHTLSLGMEYRHDYEWDLLNNNYVFNGSGYDDLRKQGSRKTSSIYAYDEFSITPKFKLNYGLRYEESDSNHAAHSYQGAFVYQPYKNTNIKFSLGQTKRQTTPYEYIGEKPEQAETAELVVESLFADDLKLLTSFYQYKISNRISWTNDEDVHTKGAEAEVEKHWSSGVRVHASYAYQDAHGADSKVPLANGPKHIVKFNLSTPLLNERLRLGVDAQYIDKRRLDMAETEYAKPYTLVNITLLSHEWIPNCDVSLKVRNLMDVKYNDVIWEQYSGDSLYPQDGRNFWLELEYRF